MTSRTSYKPEGFPKRADEVNVMVEAAHIAEKNMGLFRSALRQKAAKRHQDVREYEREIGIARYEMEALVHDSLRHEPSNNELEAKRLSASERLVIAYRALKAWEAERG